MNSEDYKKAAEYWLLKDREANLADRETLLRSAKEIISSHQNGVLGTCCDGLPRCTPVDYAYFNNAFYILTEGGLKFKGLEQNKNVSFTVFNHDGNFGNLKSIQVTGIAEIVGPDTEEYSKNAEIRKYPLSALQKINMHLLKIIPKEMIILDSALKQQGFSTRGTVIF